MAGEEGRVGEEAAGGHEAREIRVARLRLLLLLCGDVVAAWRVFLDGESCEVGRGGGSDGESREIKDIAGEQDGERARVLFGEDFEGFGADGGC